MDARKYAYGYKPKENGLPADEQRTAIVVQGKLLTAKLPLATPPWQRPGKRNAVLGFSESARRRMLKWIAVVSWDAIKHSLLVTLTYPDAVVDRTYARRTRDRQEITRRIEEQVGSKVATLWRVEWQERKSGQRKGEIWPHLHMVVMGQRFIPCQWLRDAWASTIGYPKWVSTDVRNADSGKHAAAYAAKYAAKAIDLNGLDYESYRQMSGRAWGVTRKELVPICKAVGLTPLPAATERIAHEVGDRVFQRHTRRSWWVVGDRVEALKQEIEERGGHAIDMPCDEN